MFCCVNSCCVVLFTRVVFQTRSNCRNKEKMQLEYANYEANNFGLKVFKDDAFPVTYLRMTSRSVDRVSLKTVICTDCRSNGKFIQNVIQKRDKVLGTKILPDNNHLNQQKYIINKQDY